MKRLLAWSLIVCTSAPAFGQKLAPGLWEMTMQMPGGPDLGAAMAQMQEQLAKMPPEQRKQIEAMLAQQGVGSPAVKPGAAPGQPAALRVCISKEAAARGDIPDPEGRCRQDNLRRSGNKVNFDFSCTNPPATGSGEYVFTGDRAYTGRMLMNTERGGKKMSAEMQLSGKFVSADCGDVKPRDQRQP
jgi:hypothetical protein